MPGPQSESKEAFDLLNCPTQPLGSMLRAAAGSPKCDTLNLSTPDNPLNPKREDGTVITVVTTVNYRWVTAFLTAYPRIKNLNLSGNQVYSAAALNAIGEIPTLETLNLAHNGITYPELIAADVFLNNKTLKHLDISSNCLWTRKAASSQAPQAKKPWWRITNPINESNNVNESNNELKKDAASLFAGMALESLNLSKTQLQTLGSLRSSRTLKAVNISWNFNYTNSHREIIELASNPDIRELNVAHCGVDIRFLLALTRVNSTLKVLDCSGVSYCELNNYEKDYGKCYEEAERAALTRGQSPAAFHIEEDTKDAVEWRRTSIWEQAFDALSQMQHLSSLTIDNISYTPIPIPIQGVPPTKFLEQLAQNKTIRNLSLERVTHSEYILDLCCLTGNSSITSLNLKNNMLDNPDDAAKILASMPQLRWLNIVEPLPDVHYPYTYSGIGYDGAKFLLDKADAAFCKTKRLAFLMGTHERLGTNSSISAFLKYPTYDRNMLKLILAFCGEPFVLVHNFSPDIMEKYHEAKQCREVEAIQEAAVEQADYEQAIAASLATVTQQYVVLHPQHHDSGVTSSHHAVPVQVVADCKISEERNIADAEEEDAEALQLALSLSAGLKK